MEAAIFKNESEKHTTPQSYERSQEQLQWFTKELSRMNLVGFVCKIDLIWSLLTYR